MVQSVEAGGMKREGQGRTTRTDGHQGVFWPSLRNATFAGKGGSFFSFFFRSVDRGHWIITALWLGFSEVSGSSDKQACQSRQE
jgi:hypothetical protein